MILGDDWETISTSRGERGRTSLAGGKLWALGRNHHHDDGDDDDDDDDYDDNNDDDDGDDDQDDEENWPPAYSHQSYSH